MNTREISINNIKIGGNNPFVLIAGPCSMESEKLIMETAEYLKNLTSKLNIPFIFKSSFDKANRTSIEAYRGPGLDKGLKWMQKVKEDYELSVTTDIHLPQQAQYVAEVVDIIQIPAFLCRQTDLLTAAAKTNKPVNIKKGQFLAPWDMINVVNKIFEKNNHNVILTERGSMFGYNNLVVDMTGLVEMKKTGCPVIFDGTHSVQKPGGKGSSTGGNREYVEYLSRAAISIGIDGLFLETHPDPDRALSDGPNMIKLCDLGKILEKIKLIDDMVKSGER